LRLFDPVTGTRGADLLLGPLEPDVVARAAYRLPTEHRGVIQIGPLEVIVGDPFGLVSSSTIAAPVTELTVFPHIDDIVPVPHTSGDDPHAGADHPSALGRSGEDFYSLRPYVVGDDLRRVHWPSTARRDELMVRVEEAPWRGGTTVLLDRRSAAHRGSGPAASLEWAVSMAGSVCLHLLRHGHRIRLITEDGALLAGGGDADNSADAVLDALAGLQTSALHDLAHCRPLRDGQDVIAILGGTTVEAAAELLNSRARATRSRAVLLDVNRWASVGQAAAPSPDAAARLLGDAGWDVVTAGPHQSMDAVWRELCDEQHAVLAAVGR
jgi:uncharacterized protein (DUF58 family)